MVFVIRRILQSVVVVLVMSLVVFVGVHLVGDPVHILISDDMTQAEIDAFIQRLGLDRPVYEQYFHFLANAARGDLGNSFVFGEPALKLILQRMPATLELAFAAFILAIVFGIPLGMYAGLKPDSPASRAIMAGSILGFSLPTFWVGLMLIMVFAVMLGWLPSTGRGDFMTWDGLRHLALPALNLALFKMALGHPPRPRRHARGGFAGLREIRARQGTFVPARGAGACAEKHPDSGGHRARPRARRPDRLLGGHRDGVRLARAWASSSSNPSSASTGR